MIGAPRRAGGDDHRVGVLAGDAAQAALFTRFVPALTHAAAHSMSWKQREERRVPNGDEELIAPSEHERREAGA